MIKIIYLILITSFLTLTSCGSDNDNRGIEDTFLGSYTSISSVLYQYGTISGNKLQGDKIMTNNMFSGYTYTPPIYSGNLNYNKSYIKVTGLTNETTTLYNFTVIINGISKNLGNLNSDVDLSTNDILDYLNQTLNSIVNKGELDVVMEFTANKTILAEDNIRLIINYDGIFKYYK